jgi:hypothetical protein
MTTNANTNTATTYPILLCYGDSVTHGNCSEMFILEITLQLSQKLGVPLLQHPHRTFAYPLWEVNAG